MNEILMCGTDPVGQLYKDTKAEATSIAPIEVSPAESSHSVGTHIMVDGVRYRVTSAISIGDTLTIGTNISAENIEDNLNAEDVAYDSNTSVKEKIDSITDFSTTETVVGKWIDGKTLYRKVYSKTFTFTAGETVDDVFSVDDLNADTIIIENGFIRIQSNITYVGNEAFVAFIRRTNWDRIAVKCDNVAYSGGTLVFVVLYTKA